MEKSEKFRLADLRIFQDALQGNSAGGAGGLISGSDLIRKTPLSVNRRICNEVNLVFFWVREVSGTPLGSVLAGACSSNSPGSAPMNVDFDFEATKLEEGALNHTLEQIEYDLKVFNTYKARLVDREAIQSSELS